MRVATKLDGTRDGALQVVSTDGCRMLAATEVAPNLLQALERWDEVAPQLQALTARLDADPSFGEAVDEAALLAPLPRTWQFLDASAFLHHGRLLERSLGVDPIHSPHPLMYQGIPQFLPPRAHVPFRDFEDDYDFEGEFAVILRDTPAGVSAAEAEQYVVLIAAINDWSMRAVLRREMGLKFGYIESKPASGMLPFAATPEEFGAYWREGRIHATLEIERSGVRFGEIPAHEMDYSFGELIARAAATRDLPAGTVIGSGTVASANYAETGSACIAERRGIETIAHGEASTPYLSAGESVRIQAVGGGRVLLGTLEQTLVQRPSASM